MDNQHNTQLSNFLYACYAQKSKAVEEYVPEHVLTYIISGSMVCYTAEGKRIFSDGDLLFIKRNQLAKAIKQPGADGEMKSLTVFFDQASLRTFYDERILPPYTGVAYQQLHPDPLYINYFASLAPYTHLQNNEALAALKLKELLLLVLHVNPELKNVLFDFNEPAKIDLEEYMNKHYNFNVEIKRFAYLTGRSLATFKRDFEKTFHTSPSRWLQQRRLQEAYSLIKEKGRKPSDVYLEVGFEDLSHFSFAFKKTYGVAPSFISAT
jgi:AraC-like DNA-binding protein